jgi:hypothetical protein
MAPFSVSMSNAHGDRLTVSLSPMGRSRVCSPGQSSSSYPAC